MGEHPYDEARREIVQQTLIRREIRLEDHRDKGFVWGVFILVAVAAQIWRASSQDGPASAFDFFAVVFGVLAALASFSIGAYCFFEVKFVRKQQKIASIEKPSDFL